MLLLLLLLLYASQAFSVAHCTDSEDLPLILILKFIHRRENNRLSRLAADNFFKPADNN